MEKNLLDDFEHSVSNKVRDHKDEPGFPQPEDFGLEQRYIDDYLFQKQAILDSLGTQKARYTLIGILIVLPVLVASAFPEEDLPYGMLGGTLLALAAGIVLALLVMGILRLIRSLRLRRMRDASVEQYISAVLSYQVHITEDEASL